MRIRWASDFAEEIEAGEVLQIAQMLALVGKAAAGEGEDILQMAADGEQRRRRRKFGQRHAERNKAAGAADQLRRAIDDGGDRIVAALQNFAVVHQEGVGDVAEPGEGLVVVDGDGLFAEVGGGHDEGLRRANRQRADAATARKAERRPAREFPAQPTSAMPLLARLRARTMGRADGVEQSLFLGGELADCARGLEIADHHGERLAVAVLALAQAHDGCFVGGVDGEMKAADAFDGEDLAGQQAARWFL